MTTVGEAVRNAAHRLLAACDTARLDAELLMAHALGTTRSELLVRHMGDGAPPNFAAFVERRALHEPIAYITGEAEFFGRPFIVSPDTLIPRGDSETLIRAALAVKHDAYRVLDLGTGTGALLLTFLAETQAVGLGLDANGAACDVARRNAVRLQLNERADIRCGNWREDRWSEDLGTFDLILCNPPYVESTVELAPDVRQYEPASALYAGPDGLHEYRVLIPQIASLMNEDAAAILEIGHAQADAVTALAHAAGFATDLHRDLADRPRAVVLR